MMMQLNIPDSIVKSIRLPENRIESELLKELAVALYAQEMLSFAQARELAKMGHYEFGQLLGERKVIRHYGKEELQEDLNYARGQ
jgi:predicted HTH domain antitoxin